jgi:hypothetical protein
LRELEGDPSLSAAADFPPDFLLDVPLVQVKREQIQCLVFRAIWRLGFLHRDPERLGPQGHRRE